MPDVQRATGDRVRGRDISATVVGHHALDGNPVLGVEAQSTAQEADRSARALVLEHLDVGETAVVVDRDVAELPADRVAFAALVVDAAAVVVPAPSHAMAGAALDPAELLDVDVQQ